MTDLPLKDQPLSTGIMPGDAIIGDNSAVPDLKAPPAPGVRRFGRVNWVGLQTLSAKEVKRFLKVAMQTIFAPAFMSVLFLIIFTFAVGQFRGDVGSISYTDFLVPGLIMMTVLQNAFANTSSSLMIAKIQGNIVDYLMPPLSAGEVVTALVLGGIARGVLVALVTAIAMAPLAFVSLQVYHLGALLFFAIGASMMLSLIGLLAGIWAEKFDHLATVTNFLVTPLAFLSGTFYSVAQLPPLLRTISDLNPFHYLIDGFRFGMTGQTEVNLTIGVLLTLVLNIALGVLVWRVFRRGYRLKA